MTNLFDWNTKELFLYVTAEYETEKNVRRTALLLACPARLARTGSGTATTACGMRCGVEETGVISVACHATGWAPALTSRGWR